MGLDRLTALLDRMRLGVHAVPADQANLAAVEDASGRIEICLQPREIGIVPDTSGRILFSLSVDFGSEYSPLLNAMPALVSETAQPDSDTGHLTALLAHEYRDGRCGGPAVMARLGEVLVVWILRRQIERGTAAPGLFGGLAHPRISHALVAMHDAPERGWRSTDLAERAGLSHSHFKQLFGETVGVSPMTYLRRWRMILARGELQKGARVERVARQFGYGAPDAFSRAYRREFGVLPGSEARV
ncbi:helix-turn-helix transcriptional regulator [Paracoccus tegillarcae]|nr:AraC family transcriptional regulator [Paracoccus tegillarcae]